MNKYKRFVKAGCIGIAVVIAAHTSDGITYGDDPWVLFAAVCLVSLFSMVVKPLLVLLALPFIVLTLGLGLWVINALLFMLAGAIIPGFEVVSFWSALWGSFLVSAAALSFDLYMGVESLRSGMIKPRIIIRETEQSEPPRQEGQLEEHAKDKSRSDDVIDI